VPQPQPLNQIASRLASALVLAAYAFVPAGSVPAQVAPSALLSGTVFQDFNSNGVRDTTGTLTNDGAGTVGTAVDRGLGGVVVTAYDALGVATTTTSAANGSYTLNAAGPGPYRLEFTGLPAGLQPGPFGTNNDTTIRFIPNVASASNLDLGLVDPREYCQDNPDLVTNCYVFGDPSGNTNPVLVSFPYSAGSNRDAPNPAPFGDFDVPVHPTVATAAQVGSTWALAYRRTSGTLYTATFMKKHSGFGPGGIGAIYQIPPVGAPALFADLNTIFGAGTAGTYVHATVACPAAPANPYDCDNFDAGWDAVGKQALGGLAVSDDDTKLYVMNLANRTLYELPLTTLPTVANSRTSAVPTANVPTPGGTAANCAASDVRPFAVTTYRSVIYAGLICSAESTSNRADLWAYVYSIDAATLAFSAAPVFQAPLNDIAYPRGRANNDPGQQAEWNPWEATFTKLTDLVTVNGTFTVYPQPMLTDLALDDGLLMIGLRDRFGDQMGNGTFSDPADNTRIYFGVTGGDVLLACGNPPPTGWTLESNGRCGTSGAGPQNTGQGPGNGEYYFRDEHFTFHEEVALGGLAQVPGFPNLALTAFDIIPIQNSDNLFDGGARWVTNSTGAYAKAYRIFNGAVGNNTTFGKAGGLGDLVAICDLAPLEIGNRLWRDDDLDGVQDPDEPVLAGVTVRLYDSNGSLIATTVTDANGNYRFSSTNLGNFGADGIPNTADDAALPGFKPSTNGVTNNYTVRLDNPADYATGGPLAGLFLTGANAASGANSDSRDSDATNTANPLGSPPGTWPVIPVIAGAPGFNNHTYDFGFNTTPTAVTLLSFAIEGVTEHSVQLTWTTATELNNFGFKIYRAPVDDLAQASVVHVEPSAIPGGSGAGASYHYTDPIPNAGPWWYWLVDVDTGGREMPHGPVTTAIGGASLNFRLFLPLVWR